MQNLKHYKYKYEIRSLRAEQSIQNFDDLVSTGFGFVTANQDIREFFSRITNNFMGFKRTPVVEYEVTVNKIEKQERY
jgi:hypothetical protein